MGAMLINSSLSATPSDAFNVPRAVAMCVNNTQRPSWGLTLDEFDSAACQRAVDLFAGRVDGRIYTSYDFYSQQVYPHGLPGQVGLDTWPLVQGASSGWSKAVPARPRNDQRSSLKPYAGACALIVRMTRDFGSDALPISSGRFAPTRRAESTQTDSWLFIMRAVQNLLSVCVRGDGLPGWSMDTQNIVVAFWPRESAINDRYGIRVVTSPRPGTDVSRLVLTS